MAKTHFYDLSEVRLQVIEAGNPSDPLLMLAHGFPEGAYSWRHQIDHFASRGWHVLAPYQRGYGESSNPRDVSAYTSEKLCGDLIELAHITGHEDMVLVGHDWGAIIGWDFYRMYPNHLRAYVGVSVPYIKWPMQPTELMKAQHGDRFFYMLYFQAVGPVEAELEANVRYTMQSTMWSACAEGFQQRKPYPKDLHYSDCGFLTLNPTAPDVPWSWLSVADLDRYTDDFTKSGFFGPVSYYRNLDRNYEWVTQGAGEIPNVPLYFIGGEHDLTNVMDPNGINRMAGMFPGFQGSTVIPNIGHWTQQEDSVSFNAVLENFLGTLS